MILSMKMPTFAGKSEIWPSEITFTGLCEKMPVELKEEMDVLGASYALAGMRFTPADGFLVDELVIKLNVRILCKGNTDNIFKFIKKSLLENLENIKFIRWSKS